MKDSKKIFELEPRRELPYQKIDLHEQFMADLPVIDQYSMMMPAMTTSSRTTSVLKQNPTDDASNILNEVVYYLRPHLYESVHDYENRLMGCTPLNIYKKIINSVIGIATRKPPTIAGESEAYDWLKDVDFCEADLMTYIADDLFQKAMAGFGAIAVSWSESMSRPYLTSYEGCQINHVKYRYVDGVKELERVVFMVLESVEEGYQYKEVKKAIVYRIDEDGYAIAEIIYDDDRPDETYEITDRNGNRFDEIPVVFFYGSKVEDGLGSPPLYNAARKNLKHLNLESAFENGLTVANFPMLYLLSASSGAMGPNGEPGTLDLKIGPKRFWHIPDNDATLAFLEFNGQSLEITKAYIDSVASQVVQMGVNILTDQQTQRTKAEYQGQQMTNTSILDGIVTSLEKAVNMAIYFADRFDAREKQVEVTLNRDFVMEDVTTDFIAGIRSLWEAKAISGETMTATLVSKEILPDTTFELEQEKIKAEQSTARLTPAEVKELAVLRTNREIDHDTFIRALQRGGILDPDIDPAAMRIKATLESEED